jgi:hypothetical protein
VQLAISDAHPGLKTPLSQVLGAPVAALHRALPPRPSRTRAPRPARRARRRSSAQSSPPDGEQAGPCATPSASSSAAAQDRRHSRRGRGRCAGLLRLPAGHWPKLWSINPLERFNRKIPRRTDVVGIFPDDASLVRLVSMLAIEAIDEWLVGRAYISQKSMATLRKAGPEKDICLDNNDKEVELIAA